MASIVTSALCSTMDLLLNKACNKIAYKLKDGDITDAKIREIIVREVNDVKTNKLDGFSREDLLSSYNFLQEGVNLLKASLDKSEEEQRNSWRWRSNMNKAERCRIWYSDRSVNPPPNYEDSEIQFR